MSLGHLKQHLGCDQGRVNRLVLTSDQNANGREGLAELSRHRRALFFGQNFISALFGSDQSA
jgi:hypothetical protein